MYCTEDSKKRHHTIEERRTPWTPDQFEYSVRDVLAAVKLTGVTPAANRMGLALPRGKLAPGTNGGSNSVLPAVRVVFDIATRVWPRNRGQGRFNPIPASR